MRSLYKILLKLCQILAWAISLVTIPVMVALWVICTATIFIIFQLLLVLHPSLGRKFDRMFQEHFIDHIFPTK